MNESTYRKRRREFTRYGRIEVGQQVRYSRNALVSDMFTVEDPQWVESVLTVVRLQDSESGAIATLRSDTEDYRLCINGYGQGCGSFSDLWVVQEAPRQGALV